jgi:NTP pyrophosphatase (non-canonical NTP hydrolase)
LTGTDLEAKTRNELATILEQCGELADAVRYFEGDELLEVLDLLDSLRALLADNSTTLRAAVAR